MRKTKNNYVPAEYGGYLFPKSCLPDILPGDRGKVLTVNQSETEAIWAPVPFHVLIIHGTWDTTAGGDDYCTLDKTAEEILTAYRAGWNIVIDTSDAGYVEVLSLICFSGTSGNYRLLTSDSGPNSTEYLTFYALSLDDYPTTYIESPNQS